MNTLEYRDPNFSTIAEMLRYRSQESPDKTAYLFLEFLAGDDISEHRISHYGLGRRARHIASLLRSGNALGDRALLLYPPGIDYIASFFACQYAGIIAVPSYPPFSQRHFSQLLSIVKDASPRTVLSIKAVADSIRPEMEKAGMELKWINTDETEETAHDEGIITSHHISFLQYTSGSTSKPRGVMLSHENLLHNLSLIRDCFGHSKASRGVIWLPPYHDMGLIGGILQPLYVGFPVVLMSPLSFLKKPLRWLQAISRYRATTSGGPNFAYELCVRKITPEQRERLDLSSWDLAFNGAEPVQAATLERFTKAFQGCGFDKRAFYPCYGLAESTLIVSGGRKDALPEVQAFETAALHGNSVKKAGESGGRNKACVGCGQTLASGEIIIVDPETGTRCGPDRIGEIWVRGPSVALGYWNNEEGTENTFHAYLKDTNEGPYLRTGDLGFLQEGELFITGRIKDTIILRGRNVYPQDIERSAEESHPGLRKGCNAAFSIDVHDENRVVLLQELSSDYAAGGAPVLDEICSSIKNAVAVNHGIQIYDVVLLKNNTLLKTSSGKIQRGACRAEYLSGKLSMISDTPTERYAGKGKPQTRQGHHSNMV